MRASGSSLQQVALSAMPFPFELLLAGGQPIPTFFAPLLSTVQRYTRGISAQEHSRPIPPQSRCDFRVVGAVLEFVLADAFDQQRAGREASPRRWP
jgi:hypothetical protein